MAAQGFSMRSWRGLFVEFATDETPESALHFELQFVSRTAHELPTFRRARSNQACFNREEGRPFNERRTDSNLEVNPSPT